jgi:hypothetical protein
MDSSYGFATGRIPIIENITFARSIYLLNAPCGFVVYRVVEGDLLNWKYASTIDLLYTVCK